MKKYRVRLYFTTSAEVEYEADSEQDAVDMAFNCDEMEKQLLDSLQYNDYDVEEVKPKPKKRKKK